MTPQTIDSDEFYDPERDKYDALAAQGCRIRNQIKDKDREIFNLEALSEWLVDRDHAGQWYCYDQEGWATACDDIGKALKTISVL